MSSALLVNIFIIYTFMKRILFFVFCILYSVSMAAQTENASLARVGDKMVVKADVQLTPCMIKGVKAFVLEPQITDGENVVKLAPIGLYSKEKFYPYLNSYGFSGKEGEKVYSKEQLPVTVSLNESVPYQAWMDGARQSWCTCMMAAAETAELKRWIPCRPMPRPPSHTRPSSIPSNRSAC